MSNNSNQSGVDNGNQQGNKVRDGFGTHETKTRDFDRVNTNTGSTIKKGNDSQSLTTKKED